MDLESLRHTACQFAEYTEAMLVAAEQGRWDDVLRVLSARDAQLAYLTTAAGDDLLKLLPDLRPMMALALERNQRIELLTAAKRDELGDDLAAVQQQRRLRMTYR